MKRVFLLVIDSFGIGASLDAIEYGDANANTFGNVVKHHHEKINQALNIPTLLKKGIGRASLASCGELLPGLLDVSPDAKYGYSLIQSPGKDSTTGHWELVGIIRDEPWGKFPSTSDSFPKELLDQIYQKSGINGSLANCHHEGVGVIAEYGQEHIETNKPIFYTTTDSVIQIAAHQEKFGLENLYKLCQIVRNLVDDYSIGRVIARPFVGSEGSFTRTQMRKDFGMLPPTNLLDLCKEKEIHVHSIGKIDDLFSSKGIHKHHLAKSNQEKFQTIRSLIANEHSDMLCMVNFADFDQEFGHRRKPLEYALALENFDKELSTLDKLLREDDCVIITGDHGCDPTFTGFHHTREHVPVLMYGPKIKAEFIGRRETLADVGQTIAKYFDLAPLDFGVAF